MLLSMLRSNSAGSSHYRPKNLNVEQTLLHHLFGSFQCFLGIRPNHSEASRAIGSFWSDPVKH
jgi:hypothetical protein